MKIAVVTVWGNDPLIFKMIESIPTWWDIILVEGTFTDSKVANHANSEYVTRLEQYPNVKLYHRSGLEYQVRNKYLEEMDGEEEEYDYALMMDSDEIITNYHEIEFCESLKGLKEGYYLIDSLYADGIRQQGRLFVSPANFRYHKSHKYLIHNDSSISAIFHAKKGLKGISLRHDDSDRPQDLKQNIEEYQYKLWKYEDKSVNIHSFS